LTSELPFWRSSLYVPVNVEKYVAKAHQRGADAIILDLEDSIPVAEKSEARKLVTEAAARVAQGGADVIVRINRPLELAVRDIEAAVGPGVKALMLPKIDSASHLRLLGEVASVAESKAGMAEGTTRFIPMIETAEAFPRAFEIAAGHQRNVGLTLGGEDFAMATGSLPDPDVFRYPKQHIVFAASAAGILPLGLIGTVATYSDLDGMRAVIRESRRFGFVGASAIHPAVVPLLNEGFQPDEEDVASARRVISGFEDAVRQGRASVEIDGKMVDYPVVERARRLLARSERARQADARRAPLEATR
jgi:citrate lyase subunit beta/citryl-CoA lyase